VRGIVYIIIYAIVLISYYKTSSSGLIITLARYYIYIIKVSEIAILGGRKYLVRIKGYLLGE